MRRITAWVVLLAMFHSSLGLAFTREEFNRVKLVRSSAYSQKPLDAVLDFTGDSLVVRSKKSGEPVAEFPYDAIKTAEYSYSKHPRWKSGLVAVAAVGVFGLPFFFMKGKKHWLVIRSADNYAVLRLDKRNFKEVIPALETYSGVHVDRLGEGDSKR